MIGKNRVLTLTKGIRIADLEPTTLPSDCEWPSLGDSKPLLNSNRPSGAWAATISLSLPDSSSPLQISNALPQSSDCQCPSSSPIAPTSISFPNLSNLSLSDDLSQISAQKSANSKKKRSRMKRNSKQESLQN
ncbi:unnamed protein product [Protopolystoma xenopodis]|uniref:Uncharacterized protein n=1 Tax=Protopolystoma xenopodis TaxID=117903 RepID=A0A3S5FDF8_9PLAT|nr:unnamed protein product [Protopolystoma xenopodis]